MMSWAHITNFDKQRNDSCGNGYYGATRGADIHEGEDVLVAEGDIIHSPIDGIVTRDGQAYVDDPFYRLIEISGTGIYTGQLVKIMYAVPFETGVAVNAGAQIGIAQAISRKYTCDMLDHLHIRLEIDGQVSNPATYLYEKQPQTAQSQNVTGLFILGVISIKLFKLWTKNFY